MVQALAARFPFTGGGTLVLYRPAALERYFPVAPGIEVSVEPGEDPRPANDPEASLYNRTGRMSPSRRKGIWIDTYR